MSSSDEDSESRPPPQPTRPSFFRSISSSSTSGILSRKDKPRLYIAIFPKGGSSLSSSYSSSLTCDSYHWALLVGPQTAARSQPGTCYQIVHDTQSNISTGPYSNSYYEEKDLSDQSQALSAALLARITLAKVVDEKRLKLVLQSLPPAKPTSSGHCQHSDSGYDTDDIHATSTCLTWVKTAYKLLIRDTKCVRGYIGPEDWAEIEEVARLYARKKRRQGRFGGREVPEAFRTWKDTEVPTWNFWENRETTR